MTDNSREGRAVLIGVGAAALVIVLGISLPPLFKEPPIPRYITIATASATGAYHSIGVEICSRINGPDRQLGCIAAPSRGSEANISLLRDPLRRVEAALVQSDVFADHASDGEALVAISKKLAASEPPIILAHEALFVLVRRDDEQIERLEDLAGRKLALDREGSGTRGFAMDVLEELGITVDEPSLPNIAPADYPDALCDGRIDAGFWVVSSKRKLPRTGETGERPDSGKRSCELRLLDVPRSKFKGPSWSSYEPTQIYLEGCTRGVKSFGPLTYLATSKATFVERKEDFMSLVDIASKVAETSARRGSCDDDRNRDDERD